MDRESPLKGSPGNSKSVVDANGVRHPSKAHMERYLAWKPGMHLLGDEAQAKVEALIHEFMQEKHDACNGEKDKIEDFVRRHDSLIDQCWDRIKRYEKQATEFRRRYHIHEKTGQRFKMRQFDWGLESAETVRGILRAKDGNQVLPLTVMEREQRRMFAEFKNSQTDYPWREPFTVKPEFQGENHPLERGQVQREPMRAERSERAERALRGLPVPERDLDGWERDLEAWERSMPRSGVSKPVRVREGLGAIFADLKTKYGPLFRTVQNTKPGRK